MKIARCLALATAIGLGGADVAAAADFARDLLVTRDPRPASAWRPTPYTHGALPSSGPNCAPYAYGSPTGPIWLGHFAGGNVGPRGAVTGGLDWRDVYACFPGRANCQAWQRDMRRVFHRLEGYRTCLLIR